MAQVLVVRLPVDYLVLRINQQVLILVKVQPQDWGHQGLTPLEHLLCLVASPLASLEGPSALLLVQVLAQGYLEEQQDLVVPQPWGPQPLEQVTAL